MSDEATSENDSKRTRVTNPYLRKPAATRKTLNEGSASSGVTSSVVSAPIPAKDVQEETKPAAGAASDSATTSTATTTTEKQTFGEKEPAVERLPSRNVSFGSAEILTVTELRKHASLYMDQSVRITGVVLHRHVASDGNVCLVLKDPSIQPTTKTAKPLILKTPGGGIQRRRSLNGTNTPRFVTRKRPFSSLKKPPAAAVDPVKAMVTSLVENQAVLVYAVSKQMPVNDAAVGDLIMIIGQVKTVPVPALVTVMEKWNEESSFTNSFVHARILRNVNGTDMRLHDEALKMRRLYLQKTMTNQDESLLQGCGPPPYFNTNDNANEMNV